MIKFNSYFGRMDEGLSGTSAMPAGEGIENAEDEAEIIADEDGTESGLSVEANDEAQGGMGTGEYGLPGPKFAQGDIDVVDQMARTTRAADKVAHREGDAFPGFDTATETEEADDEDAGGTTH